VDLDNLNELGYNKVKATKALSIVNQHKHDLWDAAYEFWRNSILSAGTTFVANAVGSMGNAAWHYTAERMVEAGANVFIQDPKGAQLGEFKYLLAGILPSLSQAARNFAVTFDTEMPQFEQSIGREGQFKIETPDVVIKGIKGRGIRIPQRLMSATDDFYKTLFANMEVGARAYRQAKAEGLKGEAMQDRIRTLTSDLESAAWQDAGEMADELTFTQKGGKFSQTIKRGLLHMRRESPGLSFGYLFPFITTPINIFSSAIQKTPIGGITLAHKMYGNYRDGKHVLDGLSPDIARQALAWAAILALLSNDEEDPWITGAEGSFDANKRGLARRTHPPQSVKIGSTWHSYSRLEPFATAVSLMVDATNSMKSGSSNRMANTIPSSLFSQFKDKTFLSGIGDILKATESDNTTEGVGKWASSFAVSWIPNILRSAGRAAETEYDQTSIWGDGRDWWEMLGKRTIQRTEIVPAAITGEQPIYDLWGRTAPTSRSPIPATDWLYKMTVPSTNKKEDIHIGDRVLLNYNLRNPDSAKYPDGVSKQVTFDKQTHVLTDKQYAWLLKNGGEVASQLVEQEDWPEEVSEEDIERLTGLISDGRSIAREELKESIRKGREPKLDDLDGKIRSYRISKAITASKKLLEARPTKLTSREEERGMTLAQKREEWQAQRDEARRQIEMNPLGKEAILKGYREWLKEEVKDPDTQYEKLVKFRSQMGWKGLKR
jgi:hypothetical protein